jgi:hypothetical protein
MATQMKKVILCVNMQPSVCGFELHKLAKNFLYICLNFLFGGVFAT